MHVPTAALLLAVACVPATRIHDAVEANNLTSVADILSDPAHLESLDDNLLTPLQLAAYLGHVEATRDLVHAGARLETAAAEQGNMRALHWASGQGHDDVLEALISAGAALEATDGGGRTALHFAAARGYTEAAQVLCKAGANVEALSGRLVTALQMAAEKGHVETAGALAECGANLDVQADEARLAPLHVAAAMGHAATVIALLHAGAQVDLADGKQRTPLHHAAARGHRDALAALISAGADLEAADERGQSPRRLAESARHRQVVQLLKAALKAKGAEAARKAPPTPKRVKLARYAEWGRKLLRRLLSGATKSCEGRHDGHAAGSVNKQEV